MNLRSKTKTIKRLFSAILSVCITITAITSAIPPSMHLHALVCGNHYEDCFDNYVEGQLTYSVHNAASFNKFRELVNSGIDFAGVTIIVRNNILTTELDGPIGTAEHPFNGILDGNRLTIRDTNFSNASLQYNGIFGYVGAGGVIKNLTVYNCSFTGGEYCGAIAGKCDGTIENCSVSNITVSGTKYVGTLAGMSKSDISGKCASGSVTLTGDDGYAGGLVGYLEGNIFNCGSSASVTVTGSSHGGGIAGYLGGTAVNSYASGDVLGDTAAKCGGFAAITKGICKNCYAAGDVTGATAAGFSADCRAALDKCYWNSTEVTEGIGTTSVSTVATAKTAAELSAASMPMTLNSYAMNIINALGWESDAGNVNGGFPVLTENVAGFAGGDGTSANPFLISSAGHLKLFSTLVTAKNAEYASLSYKMTADITFDATVDNNFTPIGYWDGSLEYGDAEDTTVYFSGVFDGGGHTINGVNISQSGSGISSSLFSALNPSARVMNLNVENIKIISNYNSGCIAATNYGTITNCSVSGNINVSIGASGGVVGMNYGSVINCISHVEHINNVSSSNAGGIIGANYKDGSVVNCFADSTFANSVNNIISGGICGENSSGSAAIDGFFLEREYVSGDCGGTAISSDVVSGAVTYADTGKTVAELLSVYALTDTSLLLWTNDESGNLCFDYPEVTYSCEYGTALPNVKVMPGALITFTAMPNDHFVYFAESFTAVHSSTGASISGTESGSTYTITAPQTDITIGAEFCLEGDGSEETPFCIYNAENIRFMAQNINSGKNRNSEYVLMNSVSFTADESALFIPIGTQSSGFIGHFDGRGNTISKLVVTKTVTEESGYLGFFGYVSGGRVENLSVNANLTISASSNNAMLDIGGIAAYFLSGSINNCAFSGKITATGGTLAVNAGGISGSTTGTIVNCSNAGSISSTGNAGGLVGTGNNCIIWNSYNRGAVTKSQYGGGIIGYASDDTIENCYSCAEITGTNVGAIAGYSEENSTRFMYCTYSSDLFGGSGTNGYTDDETGISAAPTQAIKMVTFSTELNNNLRNPLLPEVTEITTEPSGWMQNSVTAAGCPAFMWQKINVVRNDVTSVEYWDLQTAADASSGAQLTLLASNAPAYTLNVASGNNLFLSMAGMTLTCPITNAGTMVLSSGTLNSNITNTGSLSLTDIIVSGSGALTSGGTLTLGGGTSISATGGIKLQSGYIGVSSALTAQTVAAVSSDLLVRGFAVVKGTGFTLSSDYCGKFKLPSGSLEYFETQNALVVCEAPAATLTQQTASVYDAKIVAEGTDFTLTRTGNGVVTYSYCTGTQYTDATVWTAGLPANAGSYVIKADIAPDAQNSLLAAKAYGVVTIAKAALNVTADNQAIEYLAAVPKYSCSFTGFKGADEATVISGVPSLTCTYTKGSALGEYPIMIDVSALSAANYTFTAVNGKLTVSDVLFTVLFLGKDDEELSEQIVAYGGAANVPTEIPEIEGYTFVGWDKPFDNITADTFITAQYNIRHFNVKFVDANGAELKVTSAVYGGSVIAPDISAKTGYTFTGWDKELTDITEDMVITAQYTINKYTVQFVEPGGNLISEQEVEYGGNATEPTELPVIVGYTFAGWDKPYENITTDKIITAIYEKNEYTVRFVNDDGSLLSEQSIKHGSAALAPDTPKKTGYKFTGWDVEFNNVTEDITVTAQYTILTFAVRFVDYDGETLSEQTVDYGSAATAPANPTRDNYTFTSWDKAFNNVTSELTVTAQYTLNGVTVRFVDYDGTLILECGVEYGGSVSEPTELPERTGYTFAGWDVSLEGITSDTTITAQYTINSYTVQFVDYDGTIILEQLVEYGGTAEAPETNPVRTGYTFAGWDVSLEGIAADTTITAQYIPIKYTVNFMDYDGNIITTQEVAYSEAAVAPEAPERTGYDFAGWSMDYSSITEAINIVAQYTVKSYTVMFYDYDATLIITQTVEHGRSAVLPAEPVRTGYTFTGWDRDTTSVTNDMTVTAVYTINIYTVQFVDHDATVLSTQSVEYSAAAEAPVPPERNGYNFVDWNRSFSSVSADITVVAVYEILPDKMTYLVTFVDYDETVLSVSEVEYWATATAPPEPSRSGYTFIGWDKDFTSVNRNITVKALYELNIATASFTVIFMNYDSTVLNVQNVESGKAAEAPETPERFGYNFTGWDKDFSSVTSYLTVVAQYELADVETLFTVVFKDYDGTVLSNEKVKYLDDAAAPKLPERVGYSFKGWDKSYTAVSDNLVITAQYELVKLPVVFFDYDGTVLDEQLVSYGNTAIYPDEPQREGYTFTGWDTDFASVTQELTVTALYSINSYTVTFYDYDATVIDIQTVEYGSAAVAPVSPTRENYTFTGWNADFSEVKASMSVTAQYKIHMFTVTFKDFDGTLLVTREVPYGGTAEAPEVTAPEGFVFAGWDNSLKNITADVTVTAQYKTDDGSKAYIVTFCGIDGNTLAIRYIVQGESVEAPVPPEVKGYLFVGWDKEFSEITADITVNALYKLNSPDMFYTVIFLDFDGTVLSTQSVKSGDDAVAPEEPTRNGYSFSGWDAAFTNVVSDITVKARYSAEFYTVTFMDYNGSVISEQLVAYGGAATEPAPPTREEYVFKGWDVAFDNITGDTLVKAVYIMEITGVYTVTFVGLNGTILKTEYVLEGDSATAPEVINTDGYSFIGWDRAFGAIISDLTVNAVFSPITYTVTFCDYNGSVLSTQKIAFGKSAVAPSAPTRTGYSFTGWDRAFSAVTEDITVTAVYMIKIFNVVFVDSEGVIISIQQIEYGASANPPEAPVLDGMSFIGWDISYKSVSANLTVTAVYADETQTDKLTVIFSDYDGTILKVEYISYGNDATAPEAPTRAGYKFIGWDKVFLGITQNVKITALYEAADLPTFSVTFIDYNGKTVSAQTVKQGMAAVAPTAPVRAGYMFTGWSGSFSDITANTVITASYTINSYTVTFISYDSTVISTQSVEYLTTAREPAAPVREGYTFTGWSHSFAAVTDDMSVTAQYKTNMYKVVFIGYDDKTLKTQQVEYLGSAEAPVPPAIAKYDFVKWDSSFTSVTRDMTVTAVYERSKLVVTFCDYDRSIISRQEIAYGGAATAPADPVRAGYSFIGWDMDFSNITADLFVTADYSRTRYTVRFLDWDSKVISQQTVYYLNPVFAPSAPKRTGYTFMGWDSSFDAITSDIDIHALYNPLTFTVSFVDFNSTVISIQHIEYMQAASEPVLPDVAGYTFKGWDKDFSSITSDMTVTAKYIRSVCVVTFVDWDGTVLSEQTIEFMGEAAEPEAPQREGYSFSGWDRDFMSVSTDITVNALYSAKIFRVSFLDSENGKLIVKVGVEYGKAAEAPEAPKAANGKAFAGWSGDISLVTESMEVYPLYTDIPQTTIGFESIVTEPEVIVDVPVGVSCPWRFTSLTFIVKWNPSYLNLVGLTPDLPCEYERIADGILVTVKPEIESSGEALLFTMQMLLSDVDDLSLLEGIEVEIEPLMGTDSDGNRLTFGESGGVIVPTEISVKTGDVSLDGSLDAFDALMILQWCVNAQSFNETQLQLGDVNGDGIVSPADALKVLKLLA